uniref:Endosomal/lysosomal proton channel TMEM175 n=1 Tax=Echeneis naucrates TaxID=173247 RepID=A0A665WLE2_ECHNA
MGGNEDSDIIEHHVEEEMEKKGPSGGPAEADREARSTQSSHRLLAYSDALISIIATVMELKESVQILLTTKIAVYLMTFMIVTVAWAAHIRCVMFSQRQKTTDVFLSVSLQFSLMATFPENVLGILLFCGCVMVIGLIQSMIVLYAFSRPFLLNHQIQTSENQTYYKHHILKVIMRVPLMCFFARAGSVSYVLLGIIIFLPYISQSLKWCRSQVDETPDSMVFYTHLPNEPLSKERVEAFSDGVYAIVATLLILDICEDNVPDPTVVKEQFGGSLVAALQAYGPEYLAYFGSFATVGLLWFVHHSLFLHVTKTTRFMGLLNTFSLAFVGGLPLAYQLTNEFPRNSRNELEAIQISCVIIFFAGIFQLTIWVVALYNEQETLHPYVRYGGREHVFMLAKLALYPCVALGTFFLTCILSKFSASIFHLMEITVPFAFLVLRLLVRVVLALLRQIFCPSRQDPRSIVEEEDDETRVPFNALVS